MPGSSARFCNISVSCPLFLMCRPAEHCSAMSDTVLEVKPVNPKADEWASESRPTSGISETLLPRPRGLAEYSFYAWRKRLQEREPVRFALGESGARRQ